MEISVNLTLIVSFVMQLGFSSLGVADVRTISVQNVVDEVLARGHDRKNIEYAYQMSEQPYTKVLGVHDWGFTTSGSWELSRFESLSGTTNNEDKTRIFKFGFSKKFSSGTTLNLDYARLYQDSILNSFSSSLRPPNLVQDEVALTIKQDLLSNFFGVSDRRKLNAAERTYYKAKLDREESLEELVLKGVRVFWDAFVAKEALKESLEARDKYRFLVKTLERKNQQGFLDKGELAKASAELSNFERSVKSSSLNYLNTLDQLFLIMNQPPAEDIEFSISKMIPEVPLAKGESKLENLRKVRAAQLEMESAKDDRDVAHLETYPLLNFVGKSQYNGVDETSKLSYSDMTSWSHPKYYMGLEFATKLGSHQAEGEFRYREAAYQKALTQLQKTKSEEWDRMERTFRSVKANYLVATVAEDALNSWEKVIRIQEKNFRVGRISTAELIQDYNSYFQAQTRRSQAVAEYNYSIQEYLSSRDLVIRGEKL